MNIKAITAVVFLCISGAANACNPMWQLCGPQKMDGTYYEYGKGTSIREYGNEIENNWKKKPVKEKAYVPCEVSKKCTRSK